jgi:hypothetical protein
MTINFNKMYNNELKKAKKGFLIIFFQGIKKSIFKKRKKMEIKNFNIGKISNIYYVEDFITKEEEDTLISNIYYFKTEWISLPKGKELVFTRWTFIL